MHPAIERALTADQAAVLGLLSRCDLPTEGVPEHLDQLLVAREPGGPSAPARLIGCVGVEVYGRQAVLRSLAVAPESRGRGLGSRLMAEALNLAKEAGCAEVFLLTRTIERMAERHGFVRIQRQQVPPSALASREFSLEQCSTAVVMRRCV